ncbi:MAG: hypothetical protein QOH25_1585 [Acidobacteriota bacterium]|jgi:glycosyltransferase involved in cell wall biosynthesis|nr:hypothetical protein [Acidobacteriota bacterium]
MKIILLVLNDRARQARTEIEGRFPQALIEEIARREIERGSLSERLGVLRARRPNIFVVATERLDWQRGQNAFMLFGALAGARRCVMLDAHGAWREERRARLLTSAPLRLAREAAISAAAVARARKKLRSLERIIKDGGIPEVIKRPPESSPAFAPSIVYLRATPGPGTQTGGASSHINGVINALLASAARVSMISNDRIAGLDETKVPTTIIEPKPIGTTRAAFDLYNNQRFTDAASRLIARQPPDFIYQRYSRFSWAGVEASLRAARPLFLEYNGSEVWIGQHWDQAGMSALLERCEQLNLKAAARIFVVSEVERRNLVRAGVNESKIVLNPNAVDPERFRPNIGGERVREELGIEKDETVVGFVGTFGPWHGVLALAEAIKLMPQDSRLRFLLVGSGVLRGRVEQTLREAGLEHRAILTGAVEHERVPALLDACDVLASPHVPLEDGSEFFGSPTKLFEYMAMGKAIVASRLGQIGDVLVDEETALLVEPNDARELSAAILRLTNSLELREQLGAAARRESIARHTWTHNAARVLDAYRSWSEKQ